MELTQEVFTSRLRTCLQSFGYPAKHFIGHIFQRGGASFDFSGISLLLIKIHDDWNNSAYERYLQSFFSLRQHVAF